MTPRAVGMRQRSDLLGATGVLLVVRDPPPPVVSPGQPTAVPGDPAEGVEIVIAVWDDGSVTALNGHVDLGTGLRTALAQIVAEELSIPVARVHMVLGDTALVPNQGATIASASLQIHAEPLRRAAAQARRWLDANGEGRARGGGVGVGAGVGAAWPALSGQHIRLTLDLATPVKNPADYSVVGQSVPRVDLHAKLTGGTVFVHDMRVPGMLHGRVVRPPYAGADHGDFIGNTLDAVDQASIAHIPGIRAVVVIRDFVGIVAEREEQAEQALRELRVRWKPWPGMPNMQDVAQALRRNPRTTRKLVDEGDVDAVLGLLKKEQETQSGYAEIEEKIDGEIEGRSYDRTYVWPYQLHASLGPSCAVADFAGVAPPGAGTSGVGTAGVGTAGVGIPGVGTSSGHPSGATLTVWAGTQSPFVLRADLAQLMGLPAAAISVVRLEAAGCYGRNGADDVAADAALLSRAVGAPVRVQLTREQEHQWEPKGAAQVMDVRGGLDGQGAPLAYDFETSYPSNGATTLALLLTRTVEPVAQAFEMGDRTARPPYRYPNLRVQVHDMAPLVRAAWLRGVSALPNSFAHESYIDELASAAGVDPVEYRLRYLDDPRARELVLATAAKAGWVAHTGPRSEQESKVKSELQSLSQKAEWPDSDILKGQGFAYARYVHSKWPGFGAAWSAWVADVEVNRHTGEVHVKRVVVGHDAGTLINPAGVEHQVHGNVLQTTSRALLEQVQFDPVDNRVQSSTWADYPILSFRQVPVIDIVHMPRPGEPALGAGESASVPGTAAIANAIFDATGVRFRAPPFTPEVIREGLKKSEDSTPLSPLDTIAFSASDSRANNGVKPSKIALEPLPTDRKQAGQWLGIDTQRQLLTIGSFKAVGSVLRLAGAALLGGIAMAAALLGWRSAIAPVANPGALAGGSPVSLYSPATLERGRQLAALGDCAVCHTAPGGARNAGGRAITTPFGTVYSTNLTPDAATGLGAWPLSAFQRAMREGVSRDGHYLYPAFPYTAFIHTTDEDLAALYGYLMSQTLVHAPTPNAEMRFPVSLRPLMAVWNGLFLKPASLKPEPLKPEPLKPESARGAEWQRGAYLVNGLGHCGACHTPRNALGAEQGGAAYLSGATVDGWEAPALTSLSKSPVAWTAQSLYQYLRQGHSPNHGAALGPMADVVRELQAVPDADLQAMAVYLAGLNDSAPAAARASAPVTAPVTAPVITSFTPTPPNTASLPLPGPAQGLFDGACGACHHDGKGPQLLGLNIPLALSSKLHSDRPDNLIRTILEGVQQPATRDIGFMPGFQDALTDAQIATLVTYMRQRFAPGRGAWEGVEARVREVRGP